MTLKQIIAAAYKRWWKRRLKKPAPATELDLVPEAYAAGYKAGDRYGMELYMDQYYHRRQAEKTNSELLEQIAIYERARDRVYASNLGNEHVHLSLSYSGITWCVLCGELLETTK